MLAPQPVSPETRYAPVGVSVQCTLTSRVRAQRDPCVGIAETAFLSSSIMLPAPEPACSRFCASSSSALGTALTAFIASLATPWQTAPILAFHFRNPAALASHTVLLQCVSPPSAVALQFDHFVDIGPLRTILSAWRTLSTVKIALGSSELEHYQRETFDHLFLSPFKNGFSFPAMPSVTALVLHFLRVEVALVSTVLLSLYSKALSVRTGGRRALAAPSSPVLPLSHYVVHSAPAAVWRRARPPHLVL